MDFVLLSVFFLGLLGCIGSAISLTALYLDRMARYQALEAVHSAREDFAETLLKIQNLHNPMAKTQAELDMKMQGLESKMNILAMGQQQGAVRR